MNDLFPPGFDVAGLIYLLLSLLLVSGAGWGFWRFRTDGRRALLGLLVWTLAIVAIVVAYEAFN